MCSTFLLNRERAVDYLNTLPRLYIFDGYAGWDPKVRCSLLHFSFPTRPPSPPTRTPGKLKCHKVNVVHAASHIQPEHRIAEDSLARFWLSLD